MGRPRTVQCCLSGLYRVRQVRQGNLRETPSAKPLVSLGNFEEALVQAVRAVRRAVSVIRWATTAVVNARAT